MVTICNVFSIVPTAVSITALCFICFSLAATVGDSRSFLVLGGFLITGMFYLLMLQIIAIIINSPVLYMWVLHMNVLLTVCFILYDTQLIIHRRRHGDDDYILHSILLILDVIDLLRLLLIILIMISNEVKQKATASTSRRRRND